ncbi:MAG TPA: VOC family protein [Sporichthyaceae bacterium]|jgi:hypothetical protein|nr:VOC family protein [Sporichthyaceae bacterium]
MIGPDGLTMFHTGVIVDDLEVASQLWTAAFGFHWAPPKTAATPMRCPAGVVPREVRFTYSLEGPHHVELLEQVDPGPYLHLSTDRHIHHVGYYTDDLRGQSARLEQLGFPAELSGVGADGGVHRATYHRHPVQPGMWIELVDDSVADDIDAWMAQAALEQGVAYRSPFAEPRGRLRAAGA